MVLALRSGGAGAAGGAIGAGAAAGVETGGVIVAGAVSAPLSVPATTMFSTAAATLAAARAALAVAQPYSETKAHCENLCSLEVFSITEEQNTSIFNTFRGLFVLNSRHLAIIKVIILDTAILGFLAAINGLKTQSGKHFYTVT